MPYKDKEKNREYQCEWAKKKRKQINQYRRRLKLKAYAKLGNKCKYCGCDEIDALELNHINGGGHREGKKRGNYSLHLDILNKDRKDLELTCSICNIWHYTTKIKGIKGTWEIKWMPSQWLR